MEVFFAILMNSANINFVNEKKTYVRKKIIL